MVRNATNKLARRIMNLQTRLAKENIQISIDQLRDRKQIIHELVYKSNIIQGEVVIYLDDTVLSTLHFLSSPKVTYNLCDRGLSLENHFLFSIMCLEQPESVRNFFSRLPSITYIGQEEVGGSVLRLVR
jgi:hypothetical protein